MFRSFLLFQLIVPYIQIRQLIRTVECNCCFFIIAASDFSDLPQSAISVCSQFTCKQNEVNRKSYFIAILVSRLVYSQLTCFLWLFMSINSFRCLLILSYY